MLQQATTLREKYKNPINKVVQNPLLRTKKTLYENNKMKTAKNNR